MIRTLSQPARFEQEIKKSRFIAHALHCPSEHDARDFLQHIGDPGATHNCWAWKSGQLYRFEDDGEPGGTAGRPILAAIENQDMDQVAVVVIRYYGGIKLGTGGLARAYGGSAAECLRTAPSQPLIAKTVITVSLPFELVAVAHQIMQRHDAEKLEEHYSNEGLELKIECPIDQLGTLADELNDASAGRAEIRSD